MTPEYRAQELKVARENLAAARKKMEATPVGKKRNLVAQDVEFWGNKVAFLACAKG